MERLSGTKVAVQATMLLVILLSSSSCIKCTSIGGIIKNCYAPCFIPCAISGTSLKSCALQCLLQCISTSSSPSLASDNPDRLHNYCKLGCAASLCSTISTINNPNVEAVEGCVRSCSDKICTEHHH
ncbi:hypothetical protein Syun_011291 [Stephania yunnanensis]|uniref:Thionin-like protein 2 n=1 Tax=Stephania yunnanensis TaxID=152371 RepID=A0AAP0JX93_9MAGN